jgi:two-component system, NtrC family, sensor kinase
MSGRADMIAQGDLSQEGTRENAVIIKAQAERVTQIVRQLLAFARRETPSKTSVNVVGLINDTVHLLSSVASKQRAEIRVCDQPPLPAVSADPGQLQQVFANLLINAMQAMPRGGEVVFTVQSQTARALHAAADECYVRVDVQDQGPGIPAEHLGRIFDPFFTTKDVGEGTGLGLSIAYGIVQEHGGWIEVNSAPGRGACFSVFLPVEEALCGDAS